MKLKAILLNAILLIAVGVSGQDWSTDVYKYGEKYPGHIVDASGKKTEGFIKYQNRYTMQNEVLFYKDKDNKKSKVKYKTKDLKEYMVADKVYHCITYSGGLSGSAIKANLLVEEGCIAQYVWYDRAENYAIMQKGASETEEEFMARKYPSKMIFRNNNKDLVKSVDQFGMKFAKKVSEFVADNKELAAKVANKEKGYGMLKILNIFEEYNAACKSE